MAELAPGRHGVILLVDDEPLVRPLMANALRRGGHDVVEAASAEDALEVLRDLAQPVDMLITDVRMPGSVDGPELARLARTLRAALPVLFISGSPEVPSGAAELEGRLLLKPFRRAELLAAVDELLSGVG